MRQGDRVRVGQQIAVRDRSLTYDHLHFELSYRGLVLPAVLDPRWNATVDAAPGGDYYTQAAMPPHHHVH